MSRRVLVIRLDSLGDVLVCGPAVRAVAAGVGGSGSVHLLCGPQGAAAGRLLPGVDEVAVWSCPWIVLGGGPIGGGMVEELRSIVRRVDPDEAIILTSFHQSPLPTALLLRLAGVPRITGASVDFAGTLLDVRLRPGEDFSEDMPEPERALTIAAAAGYRLPAGDDGGLAVVAPPDTSDLTGPGPYLVVHPGASAPARTWPPANARAAVAHLAALGHRVVVTGAPDERELTAFVAGTAGLDLGGRADLPALSGVLARASVVVVANTGPAHLAAAVRVPVVSLFAPVVPARRWAPYHVPVELLGDQGAPCRDTRATRCPVPGHPCLASVGPAEIAAACERLLATAATGTRREEVTA